MTFKKFIKEMKPFHNHICILHDTELVRLIGVGEDEQDYYYIVKDIGFNQNSTGGYNKKEYWYSAVGTCISLKNVYERYENMEKCFSLNNCPPGDEFKIISTGNE